MSDVFTMPYGYGTMVVTEEQLQTKATFYRLHPEVQRRFLALSKFLWARGIPLGVGTGWRIQRDDGAPGFAKPGNSWHEGVPVESQLNALAIDSVPASSWDVMERFLSDFGLRSFRNINYEPWHIQPIEIPAGRRYATTLPPIQIWDLPEDPLNPQDETMHAFVPVPDTQQPRIFDTRGPVGPNHDAYKLAAATELKVPVPQSADKQFAIVNLTVSESDASGYMTVWGSGKRPVSSKLNWVKGQAIPNEITVPLVNGAFMVWSSARTHFFVDLVGFYKELD